MRSACPSLLFICLLTGILHAQDPLSPTLNIGDPAPPMRLREWLKGSPVQHFEKGKVYVVEFWATWCAPCRAAMPHLSALAKKYSDKVTILGINILESKKTPIEKVRAFVDSMGDRMDYPVAVQESYFMESGWYNAADADGIPSTFVVDTEGNWPGSGTPHILMKCWPN